MADKRVQADLEQGVTNKPSAILRSDYAAPAYQVDKVDLSFELFDEKTVVSNTMQLRRVGSADAPLQLDGEQLELTELVLNGQPLPAQSYLQDDHSLTIDTLPEKFELRIVCEIDPARNLALEGLYMSDGMYCTQCEAEGFRRITYYLDRPDVMSVFTTRITAQRSRFPVLLANGNKTAQGDLEDGRHWVEWHDPFKKPCYLFAMVAGELAVVEDSFQTVSGRDVALQIFAEQKDLPKCKHAMRSLKAAMRWDEQKYGREYDLDLYMIVAVDFFNMGAMENKGLNIFNTSCVLAEQRTQTDAAFQRVEAVIAHEYFHNWSGNRVTCRDWFQLSLKEGFTVFRDACFSADMNSPTVKRIEDVSLLRSAQFAEDAGPMAHPVRPDSFIEISNFYTLTIYEKGAEVIRMMRTLLGPENFRRGADLYFERHDGQAVTCEDFIVAMEAASGVDLGQFRRWYSQAGTPVLNVQDAWDEAAGRYEIIVSQHCPDTPGQSGKLPLHMPLSIALLDDSGVIEGSEQLLQLQEATQRFAFDGLQQRPVPSLLRGFSAPVKLEYHYSDAGLLLLLHGEQDGFSRWDAGQRYMLLLIRGQVTGELNLEQGAGLEKVSALVSVLLGELQLDADKRWPATRDAALVARFIEIPEYSYIAEQFEEIDAPAITGAVRTLQQQLAAALGAQCKAVYHALRDSLAEIGAYQPDAAQIGLRSLKNAALAYWLRSGDSDSVAAAAAQFANADNMTDQYAALSAMVASGSRTAEAPAAQALNDFYAQWHSESLVVNQWLSVQVVNDIDPALDNLRKLQAHNAYDDSNPNKVRALVGAFCMRNFPRFHAPGGAGYELLASEVLRLDPVNPQLAARLLAPFGLWRRFSGQQRQLMRDKLQAIARADLSPDVFEVVSKLLAEPGQ
ncbi:MAG: aminopeptidase N [Pseudomonadales bacterium]|nr:aminopeptidase N [Pseudomonadales bacterium]